MDEAAGGGSTSEAGISNTNNMQVTVKTLDSQNHEFTIAENMLVKDFKDIIAEKILIPADQQRLIFRGRVLHDDKRMNEYNVGNSTIHVVQRPVNSATRSNDEPPPPTQRVQDGIPGGVFISAQSGPLIPHLGNRNSASARLQASNRMLSRASALLRRMEEDETVNLDIREPPTVTEGPAGENADGISPSNMDIDSLEGHPAGLDDAGNLSSIISQVANAATVAALTGGGQIRPPVVTSASSSDSTPQPQGNPNVAAGQSSQQGIAVTGVQGMFPSGIQMTMNQNQPNNARRFESPRLQEMATVIQGISAFHERLAPYLQYLENILRLNQQYDNTDERDSIQYIFNSMSSIMHYLSHSYHALSDMVCDFSTPTDTRRLRAATAILLESSTVLRASIPFAVPVQHVTTAAATAGNTTGRSPTSTAETNSTPRVSTPRTNENQQQQQQNLAAQFSQQLSQMLGAGMGPAYGAQIQVDIDGVTAVPGGQALNFQDLAQTLGLAGLGGAGMIPMTQNVSPSTPAQQSQNTPEPTSTSNSSSATTSTTSRQGTTTGQSTPLPITISAPSNNNNNNNHLQVRGPFDILLPCHSHHGGRGPPPPRPPNFKQYVRVEAQESSTHSSENFLTTFIEILLQSNILPMLQPMLKDVVVNYIMRGRDASNKEHIRSCTKKLAKTVVPYLEAFTNKVPLRNKNIDYSETYCGIITDFLADVLHLTVTLRSNERYQSAVVSACEASIRSLIAVFTFAFKDCSGHLSAFSDYLVETIFAGSSLVFQENTKKALLDYFSSLLANNAASQPPIVDLKPVADSAAQPSTSSSTTRQNIPASSISPEVLPPKQAKQSTSPTTAPPVTAHRMDDDDLDELLNLNFSSPRQNPIMQMIPQERVVGAPLHNFEAALRNIPSDWVDTVRHDLTRQLGMSDQPPFSPAYSALLTRKSK